MTSLSDERTLGFSVDRLGKWCDESEYVVAVDGIRAYAAATNDCAALSAADTLAPPIFATVPAWKAFGSAMAVIARPRGARVLHVAQDIVLHRAIEPGVRLRSRCAPIGLRCQRRGTAVILKSETRYANGELVNEQFWTILCLGLIHPTTGAGPPSRPGLGDQMRRPPFATVEWSFDDDQAQRYTAASGQYSPIHVDVAAARACGLPGPIMHGLCTMAFAARELVQEVCGGDGSRLARIAVRFARPAFPGQRVTAVLSRYGVADRRATYAFDGYGDTGDPILRDGWAEVRE